MCIKKFFTSLINKFYLLNAMRILKVYLYTKQSSFLIINNNKPLIVITSNKKISLNG